ncbi:hypothetical protein JFL43_15535 [Viridibacillus sp. YIM B01967]|uniref:EamA domain-containing protein n=1 Tax=Viridibacillus soli TaxID=2798301 RepID=A0ABS1HA08_9BACL|nr:hypothetical protein [Viridibacillus soli]MBK3496249.1 hypothetical protein [Viridibacillus soli]
MISSLLILVYSMVSIVGVVSLVIGKCKISVALNWFGKMSLTLFTLSYLFFLALGIAKLFMSLSINWLVAASCLIVGSRILNGLALYGKNNWRHYVVTGTLLFSIMILHLMDI